MMTKKKKATRSTSTAKRKRSEVVGLTLLEPPRTDAPHGVMPASEALRWAQRQVMAIRWILTGSCPTDPCGGRDFFPEVRRAAALAAWDVEQLLSELREAPAVRFVTDQGALADDDRNQLRQWLAVASIYESAESPEECVRLDEQLAPIVRAMRERAKPLEKGRA